MSASKAVMVWILIFGAMVIALISVLIILVAYRITNPLTQVMAIAQALADLDLRHAVPSALLKHRDEVGDLAHAFERILESLKQFMTANLHNAGALNDYAHDLSQISQHSSHAADDISKSMEHVAAGADEQARDTAEAVETMDEFANLIEEEQQELKSLNQAATQVMRLKEEGVQSIRVLEEKTQISKTSADEITHVIDNANAAAERIFDASQMIKSIAKQTNLLALNAAIEAARAGESGKGFSVVAEEIRKLAEESNRFTEEISEIINELKARTENAVVTMSVMSKVVDEQSQSVEQTMDKFAGISQAIEETKEAMDKINHSGESMLQRKESIITIIQNLASVSEENAASTQQVHAAVEEQTALMNKIAETSSAMKKLADDMNESISKIKHE